MMMEGFAYDVIHYIITKIQKLWQRYPEILTQQQQQQMYWRVEIFFLLSNLHRTHIYNILKERDANCFFFILVFKIIHCLYKIFIFFSSANAKNMQIKTVQQQHDSIIYIRAENLHFEWLLGFSVCVCVCWFSAFFSGKTKKNFSVHFVVLCCVHTGFLHLFFWPWKKIIHFSLIQKWINSWF